MPRCLHHLLDMAGEVDACLLRHGRQCSWRSSLTGADSVRGSVDNTVIEHSIWILSSVCCHKRLATQDGLDDASAIPLLTEERLGVELDAVQVHLLAVA
eukprot:1612365-Pyramimonas_sp.AAC.1